MVGYVYCPDCKNVNKIVDIGLAVNDFDVYHRMACDHCGHEFIYRYYLEIKSFKNPKDE